jgi:hypothetical protein
MRNRSCRRHHARRVKARVRQIARSVTNHKPDLVRSLDRGRDYLGRCSHLEARSRHKVEGSLTVQERRATNIRTWQAEYADAPPLWLGQIVMGKESNGMQLVKAGEERRDAINVDLLLAELRLCAPAKAFRSDQRKWDENDESSFAHPTAVLLRISRRKNAGPVARQAIQAGADANGCDEDSGNTALMKAAASGNAEVIRILLETGADPNARNKKGETALMAAAKSYRHCGDTMLLLIENGADLNAQDERGRTALHHAVAGKCAAEAVGLLIAHGTDLNVPDDKGSCPLHLAARAGAYDLAETLLNAGAASWSVDYSGNMPVDLALCKKTRMRIARAMRARIRGHRYDHCGW